MGFKLAECFVELGVKSHLDAGFAQAKRQTVAALDGLQAHANRAAGGLGLLVAGATLAGLGALAAGLYKGVQGAADLGESISKAEQVFEGSSARIIGMADKMAAAYGTPRKALIDAATSFALVGQAAGQSAKESAAMSEALVKMATDATSFFDVPLDVALEKIRSGLVGEAEPLRAFGVLLTEDAVKLEAYRLGLAKVGKELTAAQKVQARFSLIQNAPSMRKAAGDLERTKDSPKNRQREIGGRAENAMTDLGQAVMPLWKEVVNQVNSAAQAISAFVSESRPRIEAWATGAVSWIRLFVLKVREMTDSVAAFANSAAFASAAVMIRATLGGAFSWLKGIATEVFDTIGFVLRNFDDITALAALNVQEALFNAGAVIDWLGRTAAGFLGWLGENWPEVFRDAFNASWAVVSNFYTNLKGIVRAGWDFMRNPAGGFNFTFTPLLDGFKATMKELPKIAGPAWADFSKEQQEVLDRIGANEAKFAAEQARHALEMAKGNAPAAKKDAVKPVGDAVKPVGDAVPANQSRAFSGGLEEFAKHLQEGIFKDKNGAATAANTGKIVGLLEQANKLQAKAPRPPGYAVGPA